MLPSPEKDPPFRRQLCLRCVQEKREIRHFAHSLTRAHANRRKWLLSVRSWNIGDRLRRPFHKRTHSHTYQPSQRDKRSRSSERHAQNSAFGQQIRYLTTLQRVESNFPTLATERLPEDTQQRMLSVIIEVCCQQSEKFLWEARHLFRRRQQQNGDEKTNVAGTTFQLGLISVPTNPKVRVRYRAVICPSPWLVTAVFLPRAGGQQERRHQRPHLHQPHLSTLEVGYIVALFAIPGST
ncbi:hypothetical protein CEXT_453301 [Caerostris extrusa]|uniref:Uncharacterized protein n=1 Tax=Caerostris extrusa TaxID=172846 RepID=A0AAV4MR49_CAEEX|nr:hypothetical protein CEXT_453301 [Caerostris extrusa]